METNQKLSDLISIGITTKNRWQDLQTTLTKICEFGLEDLPILIFDDGSDRPCPLDLSTFPFKDLHLQRFSQSLGLITRRNQLGKEIKTKYYLSLDDDSYPVGGNLQETVNFAESKSNLLCLSFPIYNPVLREYQNQSLEQQPYQVKFFVGCGHILERNNFLALEGYREALIHQGEEMEIAARAFQVGLYCYHFPFFEIHHTASNISRNWWKMDFYGSRNQVLWNDWYVPSQLELIKQSRTFASRIIQCFKVGRLGSLQGEIAGLKDTFKFYQNRQKMSPEVFRKWESLPQS